MTDFYELTRRDSITGEVVPVPATERVAALIEHPQTRELVRSMDPQAFFGLVKEAGINETSDLVLMATPEQQQAIIDFDAWRRDELQLGSVTEWLRVLVQLDDDGFESLVRTLDPQLIATWLREQAAILQWEEDEGVIDAIEGSFISSPDGVYAIIIPDDDQDLAPLIRHVLERLYAIDLAAASHMLETVRWELTSSMVEHLYRTRNARLGDLGFASFEESLEVYAWQEPAAWAKATREKIEAGADTVDVGGLSPIDLQLQVLEAERFSTQPGMFTRALAHLPALEEPETLGPRVDSIMSQFRAVTNRAQAANLSNAGDTWAARTAAESASKYIGIALEMLGDERVAAEALRTVPLSTLHRVGFSATAQLAAQATALTKRGNITLTDEPRSMLSAGDADLFAGLAAARPVRSADSGMPFSSFADIQSAANRLGIVAFTELLLFHGLGVDRSALVELAYDRQRCLNLPESITLRTVTTTLLFAHIDGERASEIDTLAPVSRGRFASVLEQAHADGDPHHFFDNQLREMIAGSRATDSGLDALARSFVSETALWLADELGQTRVPPDVNVATELALISPDYAQG